MDESLKAVCGEAGTVHCSLVALLIDTGVRETNASIDEVQRKTVLCNHLTGDSVRSVEEIEQAVDGLSEEEYVEFRQWFLEPDWQAWDRQIGSDSDSGRPDFLIPSTSDAPHNCLIGRN